MGFQFNGTQANVNISGGIASFCNTPSASQTPLTIVGVGNGAAQDAYTVGAGKTLYTFGAIIQGAAGGYFLQYLNNGATEVVELDTLAGNTTPQLSMVVPTAVYTTGQLVKVNATNAMKYKIFGVLV